MLLTNGEFIKYRFFQNYSTINKPIPIRKDPPIRSGSFLIGSSHRRMLPKVKCIDWINDCHQECRNSKCGLYDLRSVRTLELTDQFENACPASNSEYRHQLKCHLICLPQLYIHPLVATGVGLDCRFQRSAYKA